MTTTHLDPRTTLGQLVKERSTRARVFERHGIDYCCHGERPLAEAAAEASIDLDLLVAELVGIDATTEATTEDRTPVELIDHILATHHAYLHDELGPLQELADKVAGVHGDRHPELVSTAALVRAIAADLVPHLAEEEEVVFPVVRRHVDEGTEVPAEMVERLRDDHEVVGSLLAELRRTTSDYRLPGDACASYTSLFERLAHLEADTFRHVHLENNVLFPAIAG